MGRWKKHDGSSDMPPHLSPNDIIELEAADWGVMGIPAYVAAWGPEVIRYRIIEKETK